MGDLLKKDKRDKAKNFVVTVVFYSVILFACGIVVARIYTANKPVLSLSATTAENGNVAVYAGPNVNYGVLGHLKENSSIVITGRHGDVWVAFYFNGQQGWIQEFLLDVDGNASRLPEISYVPVPTSTTVSREQIIMAFLKTIISDSGYDPTLSVLHKYINLLDVNYSESVITYFLDNAPGAPDDSIKLAGELVVASALFSNAGETSDWMLAKIQLYYGGEQRTVQLYVSGHNNIVAVAKSQIDVYDVLQDGSTQPSYTSDTSSAPCGCIYNQISCSEFYSQLDAQACYDYCQPTFGGELDDDNDGQACEEYFSSDEEHLPSETSIPPTTPLLCKDTYDMVGDTVKCKIPRAYCSYQPATSGKPTFCNDAQYPNQNFALVVWDSDWSDLDGLCLIVSGRVKLFNGKPQIEATNRSQVTNCN